MRTEGSFVVGVAELLRQPGLRRAYQAAGRLEGLGISSATVPEDREVVADLVLEVAGSDLVAEGVVHVPWVGACRRCLEPVDDILDVELREIFERRPTEGETYLLGEDRVDLEPMVRDAVVLALPLAPLCSEDCSGPAPDRFPANPADAKADEADEVRDPRWAALDQLRLDDDDVSDESTHDGDDAAELGREPPLG